MRLTTALCFLALSTNLLAADPFLGTWKLNSTKSKFEPGPPPRSLTMTWAKESDGIKVRSEGVQADGRPIHQSYVAIYDGEERKKPGPWNFDSVINRQVSENEREDIFKKDGVIVGTSKLVVSAGGNVLTTTWNYGELRDVRVFDKQ